MYLKKNLLTKFIVLKLQKTLKNNYSYHIIRRFIASNVIAKSEKYYK